MTYQPPKNVELLGQFTIYCREHPELEFWDAIWKWSGYDGEQPVQRLDNNGRPTLEDLRAENRVADARKPAFGSCGEYLDDIDLGR